MSRLLNIRSCEDHSAAVERIFMLLPCQPGSGSELEARRLPRFDRSERDERHSAAFATRLSPALNPRVQLYDGCMTMVTPLFSAYKKGRVMQPEFEIDSEQELDAAFDRLFELLNGEPSSSVQEEADRLLEAVADYEQDAHGARRLRRMRRLN